MTMTVDEAKKELRDWIDSGDAPNRSLEAGEVLLAEVERLRAENATFKRDNARLYGENATAVDELAGLRAELRELTHEAPGVAVYRLAGDKLERENVAELLVEFERLQKVVADQALTIGTLKDTATTQRLDLEEALKSREQFRDGWNDGIARLEKCGQEIDKFREEAQTSRLALDVALKALKWFEEREDAVRADAAFSADRAVSDVHKWENENPKPGAAPEVIDEHRRTKALEAVAKRFTLDPKTFFVVDAPQDAGELPPGDKDPEPGAAT